MTLRSKSDLSVVKNMPMVNEVGADFSNVVMEVHGMFDRDAGALSRRFGHNLVSVASTSSIWSISQLRFRGSTAVLTRTNGFLLAASTFPPLPGYVPFEFPQPPEDTGLPEVTPIAPIAAEDRPQSSPLSLSITAPKQGDTPVIPDTRKKHTDALSPVPPSGEIDIDAGQSSVSFKLYLVDFYTGGAPVEAGTGFWFIQVTIDGPSWVRFSPGSAFPPGNVFSTLWTDGGSDSFAQNCSVSVDTSLVPAGNWPVTVTLTAVDFYSGSPVIERSNPNNAAIQTAFTVVVKRGAVPDISVSGEFNFSFVYGIGWNTDYYVSFSNSGGAGSVFEWIRSDYGVSDISLAIIGCCGPNGEVSGSLNKGESQQFGVSLNYSGDLPVGSYPGIGYVKIANWNGFPDYNLPPKATIPINVTITPLPSSITVGDAGRGSRPLVNTTYIYSPSLHVWKDPNHTYPRIARFSGVPISGFPSGDGWAIYDYATEEMQAFSYVDGPTPSTLYADWYCVCAFLGTTNAYPNGTNWIFDWVCSITLTNNY